MLGGPYYNLSEQNQISCYTPPMEGCCGGDMYALTFWYDTSAIDATPPTNRYEKVTPDGPVSVTKSLAYNCGYQDYDTKCSATHSSVSCNDIFYNCPHVSPYRTADYYTVDTQDIHEIKASLIIDGPAYFRFDVYTDFQNISGSDGKIFINTRLHSQTQTSYIIMYIIQIGSNNRSVFKDSPGYRIRYTCSQR